MLQYLYTKTPLYFFVQSFWRDEAFSYLMASKNIIDIIFLAAKDFSPPLYYILLHYWMQILGNSEIIIRSLSFLFFGLTLYIVFDILTQINKLSIIKGLFYLLLFILNPLLNYYAFEARMYSMLGFFATLSFYAFYKKKQKLYILATVLGLYTHYFMTLILLSQAIWLFFHTDRKKYIRALIPTITSFLFFLPWVIFMLTQLAHNNSFWVPKPKISDLLYLPGILYTGYEKDFGYQNHGILGYTSLVSIITMLIGGLIIFTTIFLLKKKKRHPVLDLYLLWTFVPTLLVFVISLFYESYYLPRYLLFSSIGMLLLVIYLLETYPKYLRLLMIGVMLYFTLQYQTINIKYRQKYIFYTMSKEIKLLMRPNDYIYVTDVKDFHVAQYYFGADKVLIFKEPYSDIPQFVGKVLIKPTDITYLLPYYPQKAFIITYNNWYRIATQL